MELSNVRFGRLTVVRRSPNGRRLPWECLCDCGKTVVVAQPELRRGDTQSCGCLKKEVVAQRNTTHSKTHTPAYKKWRGMWARVRKADRKANRCYVGVGVCAEWECFESFYVDMGDPPERYSLDRIDNTKGYSKDNCRWVPLEMQARNTRRIRLHKGVSISEAARAAGLTPDVVFDRINKLGWGIERALNTPTRKLNRRSLHG
jgi:hypothetical protein